MSDFHRPARRPIATLRLGLVILPILAAACSQEPGPDAAAAAPAKPSSASPVPLDPKEQWLSDYAAGAGDRSHVYLGTRKLEAEMRAILAAETDADEIYRARSTLAHVLLCRGALEEAVELSQQCVDHVRAAGAPAEETAWVVYRLAVARFRQAERANCITMHNEDSCIFPLRGGAIHAQPAAARAAAAVLLEALAVLPEFPEAQWLLNVAHMALGSWPGGVPERWRIGHDRLASEHPSPRFVERAARLGLDQSARAGGLSIDDFDGDGRLDVLTSSFDPSQPLRLLANRGDGRFEDVTREAGLAGQLGGINLLHGDLDDDGRLDVIVLRGGGLYRDGELPLSALRQTAAGRFADVTTAAGLDCSAPTSTAALADVDADGDLDLFVGYQSVAGGSGKVDYPSRLYRNEGGMRFADVTADAGVANDAHAVGAAFGDYDGDGDPDLYVSNYMGPNRLYRNDGRGRFEDVAAEVGVTAPLASSVVWFFDYDNDGDEDLFAACQGATSRERAVALYYRDGAVDGETMRLYESDGRGALTDVTRARGLHRVAFVLGANFGDVDNDGFPDIYLGTGAEAMSALWPNVLLRNDGGRRFQDVTEAAGLGHLQKSNGVAFADLDDDGDQDIGINLGGYHPDDAFANALFENPGGAGRMATLHLRGVDSNRSAIGARVRARITERGVARDVFATVGGTGSFGGNSLRVELGVGTAVELDELEITWPATGRRQRFSEVAIDRALTIVEGDGELHFGD